MKKMPILKKSLLILFLIFSLCLPCLADAAQLDPAPVSPDDPVEVFSPDSIGAQSFCLMDSEDHQVLAQRNSRTALPMASTTKIMTAVVIIENCALDSTVTVSPQAVGTEGSSMYLQKGEKLTVKDLLYGLMLESANDAAVALAIHASGSVEEFAKLMNATAQKIGMKDSRFLNPSGLSQEGHGASAYDMALLMSYAMKNETFRQITGEKSCRLPLPNSKEYRYLSNHNRLLDRYEYCVGGKTGYTIAAGRCLVTVAEQEGVELIAVTLNDRNDWNDHIALYEYGFSLCEETLLCSPGELSYPVSVVGGTANQVTVSNDEGVSRMLRERKGIEIRYELPFFLYAPVIGRDSYNSVNVKLPVGRAVFVKDGKDLAEVYLYPDASVEIYDPPGFWEKLLMFFGFGNKKG